MFVSVIPYLVLSSSMPVCSLSCFGTRLYISAIRTPPAVDSPSLRISEKLRLLLSAPRSDCSTSSNLSLSVSMLLS